MIVVNRGQEPDSLLQFRKSHPNACYDDLKTKELKDIREQMWKEQKGLCAYCMRQIKNSRDTRIEHYSARHPQNEAYDAASTLDYKTMLGACFGNSIEPGTREDDKTCDAHRKNKPLTINPYDIHSIRRIRYTSDGTITSDDEEIKKDVQETLNLNCKASSLQENRKAVLIHAKKQMMKDCRGKNHKAYIAYLQKLYGNYAVEKNYTPYCGIIISWLEKELGI